MHGRTTPSPSKPTHAISFRDHTASVLRMVWIMALHPGGDVRSDRVLFEQKRHHGGVQVGANSIAVAAVEADDTSRRVSDCLHDLSMLIRHHLMPPSRWARGTSPLNKAAR